MLRASSLGLRCYRATLHRGAIRCSTLLHPAPERRCHAASPNIHVGVNNVTRKAEHCGRRESTEAEHLTEHESTEAGYKGEHSAETFMEEKEVVESSPSLSLEGKPGAPSIGGEVGNGEHRPAHGPRRKGHLRIYKVPEGVKVAQKEDQTQDTQDTRDAQRVRRLFERHLPNIPTEGSQKVSTASSDDESRWKIRVIPPLKPIQYTRRVPLDDVHYETREQHLRILATTQSALEAWEAYSALIKLPPYGADLLVPWEYLHRLTRLIANVRPRTRIFFLRLLSVVSTIHKTGGTVQLWQWNVLIDYAGKGWRRLTPMNFKVALDVFQDLISGRAPGAAFSQLPALDNHPEQPESEHPAMLEPDIVTFSTLLDIATSTLDKKTARRARVLLERSGLTPNGITFLTLLRHQSRLGRILGVRSILSQMAMLDIKLGIDGVNACIWAFGTNHRLDMSEAMYKVLRANIAEHADPQSDALREYLVKQNISISRELIPDSITYTSLIQLYAYEGYLDGCLTVFVDFVSSIMLPGEAHITDEEKAKLYLPAYRAIFLGFARHGEDRRSPGTELLCQTPVFAGTGPSRWTLDVLDALFSDFMRIPAGPAPSERMIYWILSAFAKTSGDDKERLRLVYSQLEARFGGGWTGRLLHVKAKIHEDSGEEDSERIQWEDADDLVGTDDY